MPCPSRCAPEQKLVVCVYQCWKWEARPGLSLAAGSICIIGILPCCCRRKGTLSGICLQLDPCAYSTAVFRWAAGVREWRQQRFHSSTRFNFVCVGITCREHTGGRVCTTSAGEQAHLRSSCCVTYVCSLPTWPFLDLASS